MLGPLQGLHVWNYLNDMVVDGKDWGEMLLNLRAVLERIREAQLTLKPSKCSLEQNVFNSWVLLSRMVRFDQELLSQNSIPMQVRWVLGPCCYNRRRKAVPYNWCFVLAGRRVMQRLAITPAC